MHCPSCDKKAIEFGDWCQGKNAFSTNCINCSVPLKAKASVYIGFVVTLLLVLLPIPFLEDFWQFLNITQTSSFVDILVLIILALPTTFLTWKKGGYKVKTGI